MQSYYFTIICYKRGAMEWVVEMEKLTRVAQFLIQTEKYRPKSIGKSRRKGDCEIHVIKDWVSIPNASQTIDTFRASDSQAMKRVALEVL